LQDPEVIRIRFFERNPDLAMPIITPTRNIRTPTSERIGPFTPTSHMSGGGSAIQMGSVSVGGSATKLGSAVKLGSVPIKLGSAVGGGRSFTASVEEEVINPTFPE
jgi:hypothetical protein